jgi:type VI secretion system protein ImpK
MTRGIADPPESLRATQGEGTWERKLDRLALLYEGIFTVIERVHSGRQRVQDSEDFRVRMKQALAEVESTAARRGYAAEDVKESSFAVVAFLDEAILTAPDDNATNWVGKSLGEELYDQRSAGELFFKRLETLRANRDSQDLAEILEVFYLCLLLGYEGRFAGGARGELLQIMANLRDRIERILGREAEFSPDRTLPEEPQQQQIVIDPVNRQIRLFALAALVFGILCYVGFTIQLYLQTSAIQRAVEQRLTTGGQP